MTTHPAAGPPRPMPGPPVSGTPHSGGSAAVPGESDEQNAASPSCRMQDALALELGTNTDLAAAITTLTRAHEALNVRLTDTPD